MVSASGCERGPGARFFAVGGAVVRNRVKRWLRECYRRRRPELPAGIDLVVVARPAAANADYESVCRELAQLALRFKTS